LVGTKDHLTRFSVAFCCREVSAISFSTVHGENYFVASSQRFGYSLQKPALTISIVTTIWIIVTTTIEVVAIASGIDTIALLVC